MRLLVLALGALPLLAQPNYRIDTLVGADPIRDGGPATEAYLALPNDVAVHPDGSLLIADDSNNLIRRVAQDGTISAIAGYRGLRGDQEQALGVSVFPTCVAVSPQGRIVFCQSRAVSEILPDGRLVPFAGSGFGYEGDGGPAVDARLRFAAAAAFGPDGTAYISDLSSDTIRAVSPDGVISTIAGVDQDPGFSGDGGPAVAAQISDPAGLVVAPDGALLFVDARNLRIRRIAVDGTISTIAGSGERGTPAEGEAALEAKLSPATRGLIILPGGDVVFSDSTRVYRLGADGMIRRFAGTGNLRSSGDDGPALDASFFDIRGLAVGSDGVVYVGDRFGNRIRAVEDGMVDAVAGRVRIGPSSSAEDAVLFLPDDVTQGADGSIYFSEPQADVVRRVSPGGTVSVFAGIPGRRGSFGNDGPATEATLFGPTAVAYDPMTDSVLIADRNSLRVRRVDSSGTITLFAGNGGFGTDGDGGPAVDAQFSSIIDLDVGPDGRVYICDQSGQNVRVVDSNGVISRVAGTGERGDAGDGGPAVDAEINFPSSILVGPDNSVYIADGSNRSIRRVSPDGIMETYLEPTFSVGGMVMESDGVLLLSNVNSSNIERWAPGKMREYVAGVNTGFGFFGDGGPAADAAIRRPRGMFRTSDGRILFADESNHRIRVLEDSGEVSPPAISNNGIVQAASFFGGRMASDTIVSVFGRNLAVRSEAATATPLPTRLGGSEADVTDSEGTTRPAQYFFASPEQLNLLIPTALASGEGTLRVTTAGGVSEVPLGLNRDAPGLFSANADGQGVAAAVWQVIRADDSRDAGFTFEFDAGQNASVATPIPLGAEGDRVFLTLFGTGIRNAALVTVTIDGEDVPVLFSGSQPDFAGLDQINVGPIPRELAGREVTVQAASQGRASNRLTITFE